MNRARSIPQLNPHRAWLGVFAVWAMLLSGVLGRWGGTPGFLQAYRLNRLLESKQARISELELEVQKIEVEIGRLEKSRVAQEREVRRVLGYAASDEIIFDFSSARPVPGRVE